MLCWRMIVWGLWLKANTLQVSRFSNLFFISQKKALLYYARSFFKIILLTLRFLKAECLDLLFLLLIPQHLILIMRIIRRTVSQIIYISWSFLCLWISSVVAVVKNDRVRSSAKNHGLVSLKVFSLVFDFTEAGCFVLCERFLLK